ncbi:MAG: DUF4157 domain-containing protein [Cyanobacteria bacterium P01_F01_bin.13]
MFSQAPVQTQRVATDPPLLQGSILQRKYNSYGKHKIGSGTPVTYSALPTIQAKLTVGQPNDKYEQEADRVAEQIMRMPASGTVGIGGTRSQPPRIQRLCANCEDEEKLQTNETPGSTPEVTPPVASRIQSLQGGGQPLSASARNFFEPRFGQDFSHVRVHTDESAQSLDALAYTMGNNIVFRQGQYAPETTSGRQLLAHELVHTLQQKPTNNILHRRPNRRRGRRTTSIRYPKLSLYQADSHSARFFRGLATTKARQIRAIQLDTSTECPARVRVGPTPYLSGRDIIEAIAKTYWCTGNQLKEMHIFSHGFIAGGGVVATDVARRGLVSDNFHLTAEQREQGARTVSDIQAEPFASNAVVVFHGCQLGAGEDSFAEQMLRRLVGSKPNIRIFAHSTSGVCGRTRDWIEFNRRSQDGRRRRHNPFHREP